MAIKDEIIKNLPDFKNICENHQVKYLYAFGSAVGGKFDNEKSDIDLLVEVDDPDPRGEKLLSLWDTLESLLKRKVDLLTSSSIRNPFLRKSIAANKILIYDGTRQKVLI